MPNQIRTRFYPICQCTDQPQIIGLYKGCTRAFPFSSVSHLAITTFSDLPSLLLAFLNPQTRKQAEHNLTDFFAQAGFVIALFQLVLGQGTQDRSVRLAASVYLKNVTKLRWEEVSRLLAFNSSRTEVVGGI